jgi:hypothetical protein
MRDIELLREEAARCKRLASMASDERVLATLRQMAGECEARADGLEGAVRLSSGSSQPPA